MTVVLRFNTDAFDVKLERENPINPIPGESLLIWLNSKLGPRTMLTDPDAEDWGWFSYVEWAGSRYMLGSSASEEEGSEREWVLQIVRQRTWKDKLLGRGKATAGDPCVKAITELIAKESRFTQLTVESEA